MRNSQFPSLLACLAVVAVAGCSGAATQAPVAGFPAQGTQQLTRRAAAAFESPAQARALGHAFSLPNAGADRRPPRFVDGARSQEHETAALRRKRGGQYRERILVSAGQARGNAHRLQSAVRHLHEQGRQRVHSERRRLDGRRLRARWNATPALADRCRALRGSTAPSTRTPAISPWARSTGQRAPSRSSNKRTVKRSRTRRRTRTGCPAAPTTHGKPVLRRVLDGRPEVRAVRDAQGQHDDRPDRDQRLEHYRGLDDVGRQVPRVHQRLGRHDRATAGQRIERRASSARRP